MKAEFADYPGIDKYSTEVRNSGNSRNGSYKKKVKTDSLGDIALNISLYHLLLCQKHKKYYPVLYLKHDCYRSLDRKE